MERRQSALAFAGVGEIDSEKMGTGHIPLSLMVSLSSLEWLLALRFAFFPIQRLVLEGGRGEESKLTVCELLFGHSLSPVPAFGRRGSNAHQHLQRLHTPPSKRRNGENEDMSPVVLRLE